jgi:hypothetical protein
MPLSYSHLLILDGPPALHGRSKGKAAPPRQPGSLYAIEDRLPRGPGGGSLRIIDKKNNNPVPESSKWDVLHVAARSTFVQSFPSRGYRGDTSSVCHRIQRSQPIASSCPDSHSPVASLLPRRYDVPAQSAVGWIKVPFAVPQRGCALLSNTSCLQGAPPSCIVSCFTAMRLTSQPSPASCNAGNQQDRLRR